jgi:hypothetical protein
MLSSTKNKFFRHKTRVPSPMKVIDTDTDPPQRKWYEHPWKEWPWW